MTATIMAAILAASLQYGVKPEIIASVIETESHFRVMAKGRHGEIGLMQILKKYHPCATYFINGNVRCGTKYLRLLLTRTGGNVGQALTRYNGKVDSTHVSNYARRVMAKIPKWKAFFKGK